jgi:hypothetical protein
MTEKQESYFIDYIVIGIIGFAIGQALSGISGFGTVYTTLFGALGINWGKTIADDLIVCIFAFLLGGFVAGYLCYKMLKEEGKSVGLTGGFMSFLSYFIITLIITVARTAIWGADFGTSMQLWAVLLVFALIFFSIGGYLAGMLRGMKTPLPSFMKFQFQRGTVPPPPPTPGGQTCPTCGGPLRYIEQYQRWYCDKEKKYV